MKNILGVMYTLIRTIATQNVNSECDQGIHPNNISAAMHKYLSLSELKNYRMVNTSEVHGCGAY